MEIDLLESFEREKRKQGEWIDTPPMHKYLEPTKSLKDLLEKEEQQRAKVKQELMQLWCCF